MVHENEIQKTLSNQLDILEPFLTLVKTNFKLPNSEGTKGFIDILAKDSVGAFVVIELKRTNQAAREALHEVTKYAALLQREKGVPSHQIRAMIVSMEWDELIVPFSHIHRSWPHRIDGYRLTISDDGVTLAGAELVKPLENILQPGFTAVHGFLTGLTSDEIEPRWAEMVAVLDGVGCIDVAGVELVHQQHGTGLYVAIGRMDGSDPRIENLGAWEIPEGSVEPPDGCFIEYAALCELTSRVVDREWLTAYPEKYAALTEEHHWRAGRIFRAGIFGGQSDLYDDDHLKATLAGDTGLGSIRFAGRSRPANSMHWGELRKSVEGYLFGVPAWKSILDAWLNEVASRTPEHDLAVRIYTPSDIVSALVQSAISGKSLGLFVPRLSAAVDAAPPNGRMLEGVLVWDGRVRDADAGFKATYLNDVSWSSARAGGSVWMYDLDLLERWGLSYALFEWSADRSGGAILTIIDDRLHRQCATVSSDGAPLWDGALPFSDFFNAHRETLKKLVERLASKTVIFDDWGSRMFFG